MLHRTGTVDRLAEDLPILAIRAKGYNEAGNLWRLKKILEMAVSRYPLANFGDITTGTKFSSDLEQMMESDKERPIVHMVFTNPEDMTRFLQDLKEADLGVSVVASGLFETIFECCRKVGLAPHTVNYSAGIWGRKEALPGDEIVEIGTMCGHSLVSANLVKKLIGDIQKGKETCEAAAEELARQCVCGIFNPRRAARILHELCYGSHSK
jgi:hypothetical protein